LKRLQRIDAAYKAQDCKTVVQLGAPILDSKRGTGLPSDLEAVLYDLVVGCEAELGSNDAYYAHALRATAIEESSDYLWRARLAGELQKDKYEAAVATVDAMSQGRGAALNAIPISWMGQLDRHLKDSGRTDLRRRLLKLLSGDSYAPGEAYGPPDGFRYSYATLLAEAGEREAARAMVAALDSPYTLQEASLDIRLRGFLPAEPDIRAATERSLVRLREAIARHPDRLGPIVLAANDLRQLGRPAEALQLLGSATGRIDDPNAFTDWAEKHNWWWDEVGRAHSALGHYAEAVEAFGKGAATGEDGQLNVSQVINLAEVQNSFGRGEEALKTLAVFEDPKRKGSPYGEMEMRFARGCAQALAGRHGGSAADLAFARAHETDHPEALSNLLLCLGDMDGAAAAFIRRLDDPDRRAGALLQLSDYDPAPAPRPADPVEARLPALKARADVKAAIARAGGIRRFRVQASGL
jgi:tetratricopeptide (TPR) repeat protein